MKRPTPPRLLFVAITLASLYLWLRLTDPHDPAASPPAWPWNDDWRARMDMDAIGRRNGRNIVLPEEWTR